MKSNSIDKDIEEGIDIIINAINNKYSNAEKEIYKLIDIIQLLQLKNKQIENKIESLTDELNNSRLDNINLINTNRRLIEENERLINKDTQYTQYTSKTSRFEDKINRIKDSIISPIKNKPSIINPINSLVNKSNQYIYTTKFFNKCKLCLNNKDFNELCLIINGYKTNKYTFDEIEDRVSELLINRKDLLTDFKLICPR